MVMPPREALHTLARRSVVQWPLKNVRIVVGIPSPCVVHFGQKYPSILILDVFHDNFLMKFSTKVVKEVRNLFFSQLYKFAFFVYLKLIINQTLKFHEFAPPLH